MELVGKDKDTCSSPLLMDTACLNVISNFNRTVEFFWQTVECEQCPLMPRKPIALDGNQSYPIGTLYDSELLFELKAFPNSSCRFNKKFIEHGQYLLNLGRTTSDCDETIGQNCLTCTLTDIDVPSPIQTYIPLIAAFFSLIGIALVWELLKVLYKRRLFYSMIHRNSQDFIVNSDTTLNDSPTSPQAPPLVQPKERLRSLDTFRGIAIVVMIFVNNGGGGYFFFGHLPWNGLSFADLVFPWFIWIMGVSMAISFRSLTRKAVSKKKIFWKIVKRSVILFGLGLILNSFGGTRLEDLRIPGVLQRFAISYLVVSTLHMFNAKSTDSSGSGIWSPIRDIFSYWIEWIVMLSILIVHITITFGLAEPGCPRGYLGPGGNHDNIKHQNCTGGAAGYIDRYILGQSHVYNHPTCKLIYDTKLAFDPEGILGSLTSIFLVFLGLQAGKILITFKEHKQRLIRWTSWGIFLGCIAAILCKGSKNDGWIPVNKNLWSISFIFTTGSFAFLLLSLCYIIQDVKKWWSGAPFFYPGMNSIVLYVGSELTSNLFPWYWKMAHATHAELLAMDIWGVSCWIIISFFLHRNNFFLSI